MRERPPQCIAFFALSLRWLPHLQICLHSLPPRSMIYLCVTIFCGLIVQFKGKNSRGKRQNPGEKLAGNFQERLQKCINENGDAIKNVFYTWF